MNDLLSPMLSFLFDWSIRWGLLILGLALWLRMRPPSSVATRLLLGRVVLIAGLLLPLTPRWWNFPLPNLELNRAEAPALSEPQSRRESLQPEILASDPSFVAKSEPPKKKQGRPKSEGNVAKPERTRSVSPSLVPAAREPVSAAPWQVSLSWQAALVWAWAAGVAFFLLRLGVGMWWMNRTKLQAATAPRELVAQWEDVRSDLKITRNVTLLISDRVACPTLFGGLRPAVLLSPNWANCPREERRIAFVHEWTHARHADDWAKWMEELVRAFFFFHPLLSWLLRQLDRNREQRCDAATVAAGVHPRDIATCLLRQVKRMPPGRSQLVAFSPSAAISFFHPHSVSERIHTLLEVDMNRWRQPLGRARSVMMTVVILAAAASLGGFGRAVLAPAAAAASTAATPVNATTAPEPEVKDAVAVTGTVLMEDGKAAAEAIVLAAQLELGVAVRRETKCDSNGVYRLNLPPGPWLIAARKGSQGGEASGGSISGEVEIKKGMAPKTLPIRMKDRGMFRGQLFEQESGKPIAQGKLFLDNGVILVTDSEGKWELGGMTRTHHEAFVVAADRQRLRVLFDTTKDRDSYLELRVERGAHIRGIVTDAAGKPIPEAVVGRTTSGGILSLNGIYTACDTAGQFEYFDAVPAGQPTRLKASAPGYLPVEESDILVEDGKIAQIRFQLTMAPPANSVESAPGEKRKRIVSGTIVKPDGKPVAEALVRWGREQFTDFLNTKSKADGTFELVVPDEPETLVISSREFAPKFLPIQQKGSQILHVELEAGYRVGGAVLDDTNQPLEGVMVVPGLTEGPEPVWFDEKAMLTDRNGRFALAGLPASAKISFLKVGMSDVRDQHLALDVDTHEIKMAHGGAIKGRVVDAAGAPIRNFRLTVATPKNPLDGDKTEGGYFAGYSGMGVRFTSPDGTFVLTGFVASEVLRVQAHADGHGQAVVDRIVAVPLNHLQEAPLTTIKADAPTPLKITVAGKTGQPIRGARVTLVEGGGELDKSFVWGYHNAAWENMVRGRTGEKGKFILPAVSFNEGVVLVEAPGYARQRLSWRNREQNLNVTLANESILAGQFPLPAGSEQIPVHVRLDREEGDHISMLLPGRNLGRFEIRELPAGKWSLQVYQSSTAKAPLKSHSIELREGETTQWTP